MGSSVCQCWCVRRKSILLNCHRASHLCTLIDANTSKLNAKSADSKTRSRSSDSHSDGKFYSTIFACHRWIWLPVNWMWISLCRIQVIRALATKNNNQLAMPHPKWMHAKHEADQKFHRKVVNMRIMLMKFWIRPDIFVTIFHSFKNVLFDQFSDGKPTETTASSRKAKKRVLWMEESNLIVKSIGELNRNTSGRNLRKK